MSRRRLMRWRCVCRNEGTSIRAREGIPVTASLSHSPSAAALQQLALSLSRFISLGSRSSGEGAGELELLRRRQAY